MKTEQTVDVFQAIKIIRGTRPQFVENVVSTFGATYHEVSPYLMSMAPPF